VADKLGAGSSAARDLAAFADHAFVHAMHITTLISAAITLLGALIIVIWMPGRGAAAVRPADAEPVPAAAGIAADAAIPADAESPAGAATPVMTAGTVPPTDGVTPAGSHAPGQVWAEG
jgi:hypothetical protein